MALSRTTRRLIESGNFDAVEDEWLTRLTEAPADLDYFAGTARSVAGAGEEELSRQLLEILDEQLTASASWHSRLDLLERAGPLLLEGEALHEQILRTLGEIYGESPVLEPLVERLGLHRAVTDIPKTWAKVRQLRTLMSYDRGAVVWLEGKGAGEITDVNIELEKLRVSLVGKAEVTVGFGAAAKMLKVLPESHFLFRKVRAPESLVEGAKSDPSGTLRLLLESVGEPLTSSSIKDAFAGLVAGKSWTSWWSSAKNHPQIVTSGKGVRQTYSWAASSSEASEEILRSFAAAGLKEKLEIFRRESKRASDAASDMTETLRRLAESVAESSPAEAFTIAETLETVTGSSDDHLASAAILREASDPVAIIASLEDKTLRRRALPLLREVREDWVDLFSRLLEKEAEPRILSDLALPLAEEAPDRLAKVFDEIVAHPRRKAAAFVWLAENLPAFPFLEGRNPLRLMQLIIAAEHGREFAPFKSRLTKLVESSDTLPHLIARLEPDQAERAEEILERAPYEEYVREPLINALHLRFSELVGDTSDALYALKESIEARRIQLQELLNEEIPANRRAIEEARALGDLRENFEYKSARQRHEYLSARATRLDADLRRARVIDFSLIDPTEVRIGTVVALKAGSTTRTVTILGPWESAPESGVISYESEAAQNMLGKKSGEELDDDGERWTITSIEPYSV